MGRRNHQTQFNPFSGYQELIKINCSKRCFYTFARDGEKSIEHYVHTPGNRHLTSMLIGWVPTTELLEVCAGS
jgi:hypothetical protein